MYDRAGRYIGGHAAQSASSCDIKYVGMLHNSRALLNHLDDGQGPTNPTQLIPRGKVPRVWPAVSGESGPSSDFIPGVEHYRRFDVPASGGIYIGMRLCPDDCAGYIEEPSPFPRKRVELTLLDGEGSFVARTTTYS